MIQKLRDRLTNGKKDNKGFTLVELIVVIVILAILAALLVPALVGWIDKAREKSYAVEARTAYLAAQTLVSENYLDASYDITAKAADVKTLSGVDVSAISDVEYAGNSNGVEEHTIVKITVAFTPAGATSAVTMRLENNQWKKIG